MKLNNATPVRVRITPQRVVDEAYNNPFGEAIYKLVTGDRSVPRKPRKLSVREMARPSKLSQEEKVAVHTYLTGEGYIKGRGHMYTNPNAQAEVEEMIRSGSWGPSISVEIGE